MANMRIEVIYPVGLPVIGMGEYESKSVLKSFCSALVNGARATVYKKPAASDPSDIIQNLIIKDGVVMEYFLIGSHNRLRPYLEAH